MSLASMRSLGSRYEKVQLIEKRIQPEISTKSTRFLQATNAEKILLRTYQQVIYMAKMQIADSSFVVMVDTGSSDLWVSCSFVKNSGCSRTCPKSNIVIRYGSGDVCVVPKSARIKLGSLEIDEYTFGIAHGSNVLDTGNIRSKLLVGDSQGLLGLAYGSISSYQSRAGQLIDYLTSFSIFLGQEHNNESFLLLNGVDTALIEQQRWQPYVINLKRSAHWTIGMTGFRVGKEKSIFPCADDIPFSGSSSSCDTIVDTGTSLIYMPNLVYEGFTRNYLKPIGCVLDDTSSTYICPSSKELPRLEFTFDNASFTLSASEYSLPASPSHVYIEIQPISTSMITVSPLDNSWIIGATFLRKYYSSYEVNRSVTFYCEAGQCGSNNTISTPAFGYPTSGSDLLPNTGALMSPATVMRTLYILLVILGVVGIFSVILSCLRRCSYKRRPLGTNGEYGANYNAGFTPRRI